MSAALALDLVSDPAAAAAVLDPLRRRLLELSTTPQSSTTLGKRVGLPRQKVNYHLRELEKAGLVKHVESRRRGNCTERLVQATAAHYLISPEAFGSLDPDPVSLKDRFSWAYLVALAARAIRELAVLRRRADSVKQPLATFSLSVDVRFRDQRSLHDFSEELSNYVAALIAKHHDESSPGGRLFRFLLAAHPAITKTEAEARAEANAHRAAGAGDAPTNKESTP